jgi:signal transduction histidine kinase
MEGSTSIAMSSQNKPSQNDIDVMCYRVSCLLSHEVKIHPEIREFDKDKALKEAGEIDSREDIFIEADKNRINQVISNLLSNAIKFTDEGTVAVVAVPNTNEIVVSITDTGAGIDSEILPRLFTKFATKSRTGTGLGLFISKSIIDGHGGKIWGKNNYPEGNGATFGFSLPLHNRKFEA